MPDLYNMVNDDTNDVIIIHFDGIESFGNDSGISEAIFEEMKIETLNNLKILFILSLNEIRS